MSLGIAFKGPEGIVLAADSRVTLTVQFADRSVLLPATFDNATKLLRVAGQNYVGAVTYGLGALGQQEPRTAHSFIPEFEAELSDSGAQRLRVDEFAKRLSEFFMRQWKLLMPPEYQGDDMVFLIAGYDDGSAYGRVFQLDIPSRPSPVEQNAGQGEFGMVYGGQRQFVDRLFHGFDESLLLAAREQLTLTEDQTVQLRDACQQKGAAPIPYAFLPLQDCVNLAMFCIRATVAMQSWYIGIRGVGGAIDVATITRTEGFVPVQQKSVSGERLVG